MKAWLKSGKFWTGAVLGTLAGSWALGKAGSVVRASGIGK